MSAQGRKNLFGTSGIRYKYAVDGTSESEFTPTMALSLGLAIGTYIRSGTVVVGRDIRLAAVPIELALTSGLVSTGCRVLAIGMVTTPTLAMSIDYLNAECGVMITASHNPPEYIGVKIWNKSGLGFTPDQEAKIEQIYSNRTFVQKSWRELGSVTNIQDINRIHVEEVMKRVPIQPDDRRFSLILDPGNGSSCEIAPLLLNRMGFRHITLNSQPDGSFPGRLSEPSSKNLQDIKDFIKVAKNVELGIALDGDADRVVFVDSKGRMVEPTRILTILAREYFKDHSPLANQSPIVVTPLNSSGVIEYILEPLGIKVHRTQIGDIKVAIEIKNSKGFLGGENIGTYIWPDFHLGPDSIMTIAMLLYYLSKSTKSFDELLNDIPEFPYMQIELELKVDRPYTKKDYTILCDKTIAAFKVQGYHYLRHEFIDGVQIFFNEGWVLIRKSGTTPMLRLAVESKNDMNLTQQMRKIAEEILKKYIE